MAHTRHARSSVTHLALGAALWLAANAPAWALPGFEAVRAAHRPSDVALLDRHGTPIQPLRVDTSVRRGPWLTLDEISPALRHAIVLSEDRRFWDHGGIDWRAVAGSAWANAWNTRTRGASTVTMQLAGLLDSGLARPAGGRDFGTKLGQAVGAKELELRWSKAQILEAYLNAVPLRGELVGVAAASQQLFGKQASGLDALEAAVLAALVRAPNAPPAAVTRRACEVVKQQAQGCESVAATVQRALTRRPGAAPGETLAPHLAQHMAPQLMREMRRIAAASSTEASTRSTLDAPLQRLALASLKRHLAELRGHDVEDGAVLVLDNASGEVLAWVGSISSSTTSEVDAVLARRQPGSTLKPFVYALALERRLITAASVLDDAPLELSAGTSLYQPQNYDHQHRGAVSVREALAGSLNVPAVRVAAMLGPEPLFERLQRSGLKLSHTAGHHGHALALGSADVTLLDLTNAYRMLARGGVWSAPRWWAGGDRSKVAAGGTDKRVFGAEAAWLVGHILADGPARAATFGFDNPLVTRGFAAVKTGTSKDMRDNWCIGYSDRFTVGVWVGNASGRPMHAVSGTQGAAPIWRELMAAVHAREPSRAPAPPPGVVAAHMGTGMGPGKSASESQRDEWFIAGTEPRRAGDGEDGAPFAVARFGIESPRDGTVIVMDPEIPPSAQRLTLRGAAGRWTVDGQPVGQGPRVDWLLRPGRHVAQRSDAASTERVVFEVRAAMPRRGR